MNLALVWLRRDLRLADNAALHAALAAGYVPVPVYVHAPHEESPWEPGAASCWWLHHSLAALDAELRALGSALVVRGGDSMAEIDRLLAQTGAVAVFWNRLHDPVLVRRDRAIKAALRERGVIVDSHGGHLLAEPTSIRNAAGEPYRMFAPFWRTLKTVLPTDAPLPAPRRLPAHSVAGLTLAELRLLPEVEWDAGLHGAWAPGEEGAHDLLERFATAALEGYAGGRDRPDKPGTSRLSPHLHFGEISPRQIVHRLLRRASAARRELAEPYLRELGWRDFGHHLLYHFPHSDREPLQASFAQFPWVEPEPRKLRAWQRGRTGIPIVDAGMRELWHTGWMHNRVRMIVASLLTKNLRYHWRNGALWFWDTLVDADLANNSQGWQWAAGCGADAAPFFRIFNPVTQGERFDPRGAYVKRWVPELAHLPPEHIHQPWSVGGVRGYPKPIVDLKRSREEALAAFRGMRRPPTDEHGATG
ncbi:MAG: deoxyribodipyrimidine photo-lyase [Xanthomonadales bacterium]|nr:Deoxyribodipyrimidine photo-lyase [Xanthomonadales bacterium]MCC6591642.1 deoxyribodipyrimidine photo-lyase [Xanthomonadales bacterium]MCE7932677.1 deoxyribodipyrimidine photo-lyase [Xanthomonadales bacterium PRO6]